mmetsp:Transcript_14136/g.26580  ORF Transcript_14136/g.26580 Transcript_14136/m.26580 type:complete len:120 (-) Transcript_14136:907-1266(-)
MSNSSSNRLVIRANKKTTSRLRTTTKSLTRPPAKPQPKREPLSPVFEINSGEATKVGSPMLSPRKEVTTENHFEITLIVVTPTRTPSSPERKRVEMVSKGASVKAVPRRGWSRLRIYRS